jgi:predicted metal-binding membrane protein
MVRGSHESARPHPLAQIGLLMRAADTALVQLLKRDRAVAAAALVVLTLLAWGYVVFLSDQMAMPANVPAAQPVTAAPSRGMAGMDMGAGASATADMAGMGMSDIGSSLAPAFRSWAPADFGFMFAMWSVMMIGMMTPSVAPMVLLYAAAGRKAAESGAPLASAGWFFAGYVAVWIAFSAVATLSQWALSSLAFLTPMMATGSAVFGGAVLIAVAIYQWTPLKDTCLRACQTPLVFLASHGGFRREPFGAARLGLAHGAYCLGCCVALMALLFVGGVMNLLWIAGITILILLEKIIPTGRLIPRISGALIGVAGLWVLLSEVR